MCWNVHTVLLWQLWQYCAIILHIIKYTKKTRARKLQKLETCFTWIFMQVSVAAGFSSSRIVEHLEYFSESTDSATLITPMSLFVQRFYVWLNKYTPQNVAASAKAKDLSLFRLKFQTICSDWNFRQFIQHMKQNRQETWKGKTSSKRNHQ